MGTWDYFVRSGALITHPSRRTQPRRRAFRLIAFSAILMCPWQLKAAITFYNTFKNIQYTQTSNSQPSTPSSFYGDAAVIANNSANLTAAQVTYSGLLSPYNLANSGSGFFHSVTPFASQAAMDTAFPGTTYQYAISGGSLGSLTASLTTPATDLFTTAIPFLNGTKFSQLQGMTTNSPFTFTWDGYSPSAGINNALIFFSITRASDGAAAFNSGGLSNAQKSLVLPANTLSPNTQYQFLLNYDSRISQANAGFGNATATVGFDVRTGGSFTTGIPEPAMLLNGALLVLITLVRQRSAMKPS